jgi:phytoene dehydrogenase-like protein
MYKLIKKFFQHKTVVRNKLASGIISSYESHVDPCIYGKRKGSISEALKADYDTVIVGAGHNGLICANYLAQAGKKVLVLEKRHTVGGCAVTEELVDGYKLSRCSYVLALFRNKIIEELFPNFHNEVKLYKRNPKGLTPTTEEGKYLLRRSERDLLKKDIAKFSTRDIEGIDQLDNFLERMVKIVDPLLDMQPPQGFNLFDSNFRETMFHMLKHRNDLMEFYHFITSSADYYLDKYLESDILKGTLATDAIIGAMNSPYTPGSAYVLLHHVMGSLDKEGNWFYVEVLFD